MRLLLQSLPQSLSQSYVALATAIAVAVAAAVAVDVAFVAADAVVEALAVAVAIAHPGAVAFTDRFASSHCRFRSSICSKELFVVPDHRERLQNLKLYKRSSKIGVKQEL